MPERTRRNFLYQAGTTMSGLLIPTLTLAQTTKTSDHKRKQTKKEEDEGEVTPNEDLMREHGLLRRILLVYDESVRRLKAKHDFDPSIVTSCADIVRQFIEDYHEQLEQQYIFPRLQKAGKLPALVSTLLDQHRIGRVLTDKIKQTASDALKNKTDARDLADSIGKFQSMYRPHAAWEDTVLFPEFKKIVSPHEYDSLGEDFERIEHEKFGQDGFEMMLEKVHQLETKLGIGDPSHYTPQP
ncbi:MAG: hemerythrin domain-containing protein [Terriglobales bacterium]